MKGALLSVLAAVLLVSVLAVVFAYSPWGAEQRERRRELAWVRDYAAWADGVERRIARGRPPTRSECVASFRESVGAPPGRRLRPARSAALAACDATGGVGEWQRARRSVAGALLDGHGAAARTVATRRLGRLAARIAGTPVRAHCWSRRDWDPLTQQYAVVRGDELWLLGLAHPARGRIDLAPSVCAPLEAFLDGERPVLGTRATFELAEALVVLAHEAEHVRLPDASEAEVECYALQRVRGLLRSAGVRRGYEEEIVGLALDVSHPSLPPEYRTRLCRDGGPYDLRPGSSVWP